MKTFIALNGTEVTVIKAKDLIEATGELFDLTKGKLKPDFIVREISNLESLQTKIALL